MFQHSKAFTTFSVDDLGAAKEFYGTTLGLTVSEGPGSGLELQLAGGGTVFIYPKDDHQPATFTILNFQVDDIEKTVADLKSKGVAFEKYDEGMIKTDEQDIARGRASGQGPDIAWFKDPAGNILSVLQPNRE